MSRKLTNTWSSLEESLPETLAPALLLDDSRNVVAVDPGRSRLNESMLAEIAGRSFERLVNPDDEEEISRCIRRCHEEEKPHRAETNWTARYSGESDPSVSLLFSSLGEWTVVLVEQRSEVEALQEALDHRAELLTMHCEIANVVNAEEDLEEAIECVLRRVARFNGWQFGHAFLRDQDDPDLLRPVLAAYAEHAEKFQKFSEFTSQTQWRIGEGLPGRVAAQGRPILNEYCNRNPDNKRSIIAKELGLRSAFAFPILINAEVVGVLEFFSAEELRRESSIELESIAAIGLQLGRVVESERSRKAREKSEEHIRLMTRQLRDAVWTYHPTSLRVSFANPALGKIWHLPRERLIGNGEAWIDRVIDHDRTRARRGLSELRKGEVLDEELRVTSPNGDLRWIRLRCFPIKDDDQQFTSIAATAEDITNYKESRAVKTLHEKQLRQVTEDERQKAARDLHDDLGGLLSAIRMRIEVIRNNGKEMRDDSATEAVETIARLAEEAIATTRRLTRGLAPVGDDPDDLRLALRELARNVESRGEMQCRLEAVELPTMPGPQITNQLFRIAHEAVTNAVKHSGAEIIEIRLFKRNGDLILEVIDNGRGLDGPPPELNHGSGFGLGTMRYRAEDIGADFFTGPGPDEKGLCVSCRLPAAAMNPHEDEDRIQRDFSRGLRLETVQE